MARANAHRETAPVKSGTAGPATRSPLAPQYDLDRAPDWFPSDEPEPEVYWATEGIGTAAIFSQPVHLYTSYEAAILHATEDPGYSLIRVFHCTVADALRVARAQNRPCVRILDHDSDGWFVVKEIPV